MKAQTILSDRAQEDYTWWVNENKRSSNSGSPSCGAERMEATTVDPLHLIRIMPAQGYGCRQTALFYLVTMRMKPAFSCEGEGGFFHFVDCARGFWLQRRFRTAPKRLQQARREKN
ncbi:hypothetical protein ABE38_18160 [Brevibacillus agri]|nr:hypothetical protein D478_09258 [Brevibacillus agri BAB-2500]MBG9567291.1 hypothetical protein [Brevibacillus agri]